MTYWQNQQRRNSRRSRRRRSRRSHNNLSRNHSKRSLHNNNNSRYTAGVRRSAPTGGLYPSPYVPWRQPTLPQPAIQPSPADGSSSGLAGILNRVTEFWRRDEKTEEEAPGRRLDKNAICISEPAVTTHRFQCQLAHGSPTALVCDFNNPSQLYEKIAASYDDVSADQILFCTLNTHRVDMDAVLSNSLLTTDFIFAHIRGQKKEIELVKEQLMLGVTLSDNSAGRVYVRKIVSGMQLGRSCPVFEVGDHIEAINGESMIGKRHYYVAARLREIPVGVKFVVRLISPLKSGFSFIAPRGGKKFAAPAVAGAALLDGVQTIRFKSDGKAIINEEPSNKAVIDRLNEIFDSYLGFYDEELADAVLDVGRDCQTLEQLETRVGQSSLKEFYFPADLLSDMWSTIDDWKKGRLVRPAGPSDEPADEKLDDDDQFHDASDVQPDDSDAVSGGYESEEDDIEEISKDESEGHLGSNYNIGNDDCEAESEEEADESVDSKDGENDTEAAATPLPLPPSSLLLSTGPASTADTITTSPPWIVRNKRKKDSRVWNIVRMMDVD